VSKFSLEVLNRSVFPHFKSEDPDVILGASFGEDIALTRVGSDVLVSHVDPIVGAVNNIGWLAVHVACNDIATSGTPPRWIQVLVLLPDKNDESLLERIMSDIEQAAAETGVWARALKDIGWKVRVISSTGRQLADAVATNPQELFEGTFEGTLNADPSKPLCKKVWDKYEKYTGKRSDTDDVALVWDGINFLLEAIKISGNPEDPEAVRDAFYRIQNFPLASGGKKTMGSYELGRNHILEVEDLVIGVVKSGKLVTVD